MSTTLPTETTTAWRLARRSRIRAFRAGRYLLVLAEGDLPTPGYEVDIVPSPPMTWPPQYDLLRRERPGVWAREITPYTHSEVVVHPEDVPRVTVHHVDGEDEVAVEECGEDLEAFRALVTSAPGDADAWAAPAEATGMSRRLSFDEAFARALANLPRSVPQPPATLTRVEVVEVGGLFGGFAAFHHLVVRVRQTAG